MDRWDLTITIIDKKTGNVEFVFDIPDWVFYIATSVAILWVTYAV